MIDCAERMEHVHSDIRGPLFVEAMRMQEQGTDILKLNTGNPATFGFGLPKSIKNALEGHLEEAVGYCDFKGMPKAREAICNYHKQKGIQGITQNDVFIGNGVSEVSLNNATNVVKIKMSDKIDSLNVAVAGSIVMYNLGEDK